MINESIGVRNTHQIARTWRGPVEYQLSGTGPVVMVLNGGHCSRDTRLGHEQLAAAGFTVLIPSRPGYDSTPADLGETAHEAAKTLVALLDHLNISSMRVIGISAAGPTALTLAAEYPERVDQLVLESALVDPWEPGVQRLARLVFGRLQTWTWRLNRALLRLAPGPMLRLMLSQLSTRPVQQVMAGLTPADQREIQVLLRSFSSGRAGFLNDIRHVSPDLQRIRTPTLVMYSPYDRSIPLKQPLRLLRELPDAVGVEIPSDLHLMWLGATARTVRDHRLAFLRQLTS
ncbi:putative hydrolase YcgS [Deinococcus malanensis]|uniref:Hydrolase YcgS n=1 Tax=Deinococcus malanensis TaxID=1706855 RepID=A0ABQ2EYS5_9DEIO|nr:alpha/beta hydrolase [Deinococcus malanensis]GGK31561.1 putative hydrolase YcgS [Deinococcus malanensis]